MVASSRALPAECGMVVQPPRAATECELERVVQKRACWTGSDLRSRNRRGELDELKQIELDPMLLM